MNINQRTQAFLYLPEKLQSIDREKLHKVFAKATSHNPWFTPEHIDLAMIGLNRYLEEDKLNRWLDNYSFDRITGKTVGVVSAGNIPMAGLHDFISVLISGHNLCMKLSAQDEVLLPFLADLLIEIEPNFRKKISFSERLKNFDAIIATGSDNSARYFHYYFSGVPHIIRKNRVAIALLNGDESDSEMKGLARDVFEYFGLGCRNVAKILVPAAFDIQDLKDAFSGFSHFIDHNKYANNYHYQKAILLMNGTPHFDTGLSIITESNDLVSPISVLYYQPYQAIEEAQVYIAENRAKLQCIVAKDGILEDTIPFGDAQRPELWDYADDVDTLKFLEQL
jgi:hypothetical protein